MIFDHTLVPLNFISEVARKTKMILLGSVGPLRNGIPNPTYTPTSASLPKRVHTTYLFQTNPYCLTVTYRSHPTLNPPNFETLQPL